MRPAVSRPTWAEVDTEVVAANAAALANWVSPALLSAVVKADGYGHGAIEAARAAVRGGARWLAVAVVEEGLELREAGLTEPILVLADAHATALAAAGEAGLTVTVSSRESLGRLISTPGPRPSFHLKVDTGMHRLGCSPDEVSGLLKEAASAGAEAAGIFTHLAVADEPEQDEVTHRQLSTFTSLLDELEAEGLRPPLAHAANSAGALFHPDARFDLVRCGIALYGQAPDRAVGFPSDVRLQPALALKSRVSALRSVPAGDGVGYGWIRTLPADARIATVPIGYADGVPRCLGEAGTSVLIRGERCPLAGRVTMDQLMVVVPEGVELDDEVVLIGNQGTEGVSLDDWAADADTINYELLTRLGARLPRRYV